jgi:hypothetical protein
MMLGVIPRLWKTEMCALNDAFYFLILIHSCESHQNKILTKKLSVYISLKPLDWYFISAGMRKLRHTFYAAFFTAALKHAANKVR